MTGAVGGGGLITPVRTLNGRDGSAFGRKSYWSSSVRPEPRRLAGSSTGAGVGVALPVFPAGVVCPNPNAYITITSDTVAGELAEIGEPSACVATARQLLKTAP